MGLREDTNTQGKGREWVQFGGAYPANKVGYYGVTANYIEVGDIERRTVGGYDKATKPDPYGPGYITSAAMATPVTDFADVEVRLARKPGLIDKFVYYAQTPFASYTALYTDCSTYDNPHTATLLTIRGDLNLVTSTLPKRSSLDGDEEILDSHTASAHREPYEAASISMVARASALATRGQFGVTFGGAVQSIECGEPNLGDKWVYTGHLGDGTSAPPAVLYTLERGGTIVEGTVALTGAVNAEVGKAIVSRGNTLVVVTDLAYYVSTIAANGVPGAFSKVTTGLTLPAGAPNDAYFGKMGLVIVGNGGNIYRTNDLIGGVQQANGSTTATTANLTRVRGNGDRIVAGGAAGSLVYSDDGGQSWAAMVSPGGSAITAVEVTEHGVIWVGAGGRAYATRSLGSVWDDSRFSGDGTGSVDDIRFATPEIGYLSHTPGAGLGRLFSTPFGGATTFNGVAAWAIASDTVNKRILNLPSTFGAIARIAVPANSNRDVAANNLAVAGTQTNTTTGLVYVGRAGMI